MYKRIFQLAVILGFLGMCERAEARTNIAFTKCCVCSNNLCGAIPYSNPPYYGMAGPDACTQDFCDYACSVQYGPDVQGMHCVPDDDGIACAAQCATSPK